MATTSTVSWTPIIITFGALYFLKDLFVSQEGKEEKKETKKVEKLPASKNPWSYSTFRAPPKKSTMYRLSMKPEDVVQAAGRIHNGIGLIYDNEAEIMAGVKMAGTKTDLTIISKFINQQHNYDVYEKLKKNLNKKELGRINRYVLKLPDYSYKGYRR